MICAIEGLDPSNYTHGCLGLHYVFKYGPLSKPFVLIHHLNILCYLLYCYMLYNLFLTESKLSTISVCRRQWLEPGFRFEKLGTYWIRSGLERDVKSQLVLTRSYYRFTPMKSKLLLFFYRFQTIQADREINSRFSSKFWNCPVSIKPTGHARLALTLTRSWFSQPRLEEYIKRCRKSKA